MKNLVSDPNYKETLAKLRKEHLRCVKESKDIGLIPEPIITEKVKDSMPLSLWMKYTSSLDRSLNR